MRVKLYEIALPLRSNAGACYHAELCAWEAHALGYAGGFTRRPDGDGQWQDPKSGKVYRDVMRPYRIACKPKVFARLLDRAFDLFADQEAIFTAEIGTAKIVARPPDR